MSSELFGKLTKFGGIFGNSQHKQDEPALKAHGSDLGKFFRKGSMRPSKTAAAAAAGAPLKPTDEQELAQVPELEFDSPSPLPQSPPSPQRSPTRAGPAPSLSAQERNELPVRAPAASMSLGLDRFWRLSDILQDKNVSLSWRFRMLLALDVAKQLKKLNAKELSIGQQLSCQSLICNPQSSTRMEYASGSVSKASQYHKDVFFFGCVLIQLALHNTIPLSASAKPNADVPMASYANLKQIYGEVCLGEGEDSPLADSLEFADVLSAEVRLLSGVTKPKPAENVPEDAIQSMEELCVQCCSAMGMNRPEADGVEDWLSAIVDMVGGTAITDADKQECEHVMWALQTSEFELFGDLEFVDESDIFLGKEGGGAGDGDSGYESDDSFMPQPLQSDQRRASRLSMFLDEQPAAAVASRPASGGSTMEDLEENAKRKKKLMSSRMSIKPQAVERFAQANRKHSVSKMLLSPAQIRAKFDKQERLSQDEVNALLGEAERIIRLEPNLPTVQAPATVVGDIHGQYFDLTHMLDLNGPASVTNKYLFLGDYVDRGDWSCEVFFFILSMKVAFPNHVVMIRGNHECDAVSSYFGFKEECESKYGKPVFYKCLQLFQSLPVGAVLDTGGAGRFLCVHGGISPHVSSLEQFTDINRFQEPGMNGFMCDVLWSDPIKDDFDDGQHAKNLSDFLSIDFVSNPARGCSFRYGYSAIVKFLATNRLVAIIRAHEVMQEGFRYHFQTIMGGGKSQARIMPPVITVFSAPNYLGTYGNRGAILRVQSAKDRATAGAGPGFKPIDLLDPFQYDASPVKPVPLIRANETALQRNTIETSCPYMPTTLDSFIARALEFANGELDVLDLMPTTEEGEEDQMEEDEPTVFSESPNHPHSKIEENREKLEKEANELRIGLAANAGAMQMQAVDLFKTGVLPANINTRRQSLVLLREKKGVSSLIAQFSKAAAADGINEMHPSLVQEKMNQASKILDAAPPTAVAPTPPSQSKPAAANASSAAAVRGSVSAHRTSVSKRTSVVSSTPANSRLNRKKNASAEQTVATTTEVDFDDNEIMALQMLYLIFDRNGDGHIDSRELFLWSASDGTTISEDDAKRCITALDMDEDGSMGFNDYLAFAAIMKLRHSRKHSNSGTQ